MNQYTGLPVPADQIIPVTQIMPSVLPAYPGDPRYAQLVPIVSQKIIDTVIRNQGNNCLRVFVSNFLSQGGWNNQEFAKSVVFCIDYIVFMIGTNRASTMEQALHTGVENAMDYITAYYLVEFPRIKDLLDANTFGTCQQLNQEFNVLRQQVRQFIDTQMMVAQQGNMSYGQMQQPQMQMQPQYDAYGRPIQPQQPMYPQQMQPSGYGQPQGQFGQADPRFAGGMQRPMMQGAPAYGFPAFSQGPQHNVAAGRFDNSPATAAHVSPPPAPVIAPQNTRAPDAFAGRHNAAFGTSTAPLPVSTMTSTAKKKASEYSEDEARSIRMQWKQDIRMGRLPKDAPSPFAPEDDDIPPADPTPPPAPRTRGLDIDLKNEIITHNHAPVVAAPPLVHELEGKWASSVDALLDFSLPNEPEFRKRSPIMVSDDVPELPSIQKAAPAAAVMEAEAPKEDVQAEDVLPEDFLVDETETSVVWSPTPAQPYALLYHPSRQKRMLRVYEDGRPCTQEVINRDPKDTPNMRYEDHILNTPSGRRIKSDEAILELEATHERMRNATAGYWKHTEALALAETDAERETLKLTELEVDMLPMGSFEGSDAPVWLSEQIKMRKRSATKEVDVFTGYAFIYQPVYCEHPAERTFYEAVLQTTSYAGLHSLMETALPTVDKDLWEVVNRRATIMVNRALLLSLSFERGWMIKDFYAEHGQLDSSISALSEELHAAWSSIEQRELRSVFTDYDYERAARNTSLTICNFLAPEDGALNDIKYFATQGTYTLLNAIAANLDLALGQHEVALITETHTPVMAELVRTLYHILDVNDEEGLRHYIRTSDGVEYELTRGALQPDAWLISHRPSVWLP